MNEKTLIENMQDMRGYIKFAIDNDIAPGQIVADLAHDLTGIVNEEAGFLPRTDGCAKHLFKED